MTRAWIVLIGLTTAQPASACAAYFQGGCASCQLTGTIKAREGEICGWRTLPIGTLAVTAGHIVEHPRSSKALVSRGPGIAYVAKNVGSDTFAVAFSGRDRWNKPFTTNIRVNVEVTD